MSGKVEFTGTVTDTVIRQTEGEAEKNIATVSVRDFSSDNEDHTDTLDVLNKEARFQPGQKVVVTIEAADE